MAHYFFDVDDGCKFTRDDTGNDYASHAMMRDAAIALLPEVVKEFLPDGGASHVSVTVRDSDGRNIFRAQLWLESDWLGQEADNRH